MFKKLLFSMVLIIGTLMVVSCSGDNHETKQLKEYAKFQADSLKQCTQNESLVLSAIHSAFNRIPENNGYWKQDKVNCYYDNSLKLWVGTVLYHYDRNNTYFQSSVKFHVKYWAIPDGSKAKLFYKINRVAKE